MLLATHHLENRQPQTRQFRWRNETSYAQFPWHNVPGGHEANLTHQLRGRPGNWTESRERVFANNGRLETELSLRGIRDPARERQID